MVFGKALTSAPFATLRNYATPDVTELKLQQKRGRLHVDKNKKKTSIHFPFTTRRGGGENFEFSRLVKKLHISFFEGVRTRRCPEVLGARDFIPRILDTCQSRN